MGMRKIFRRLLGLSTTENSSGEPPQTNGFLEPLPQSGLYSLPDETVLAILDCFDEDTQTTFHRLALTSRRLNILTTPFLYARPVLTPVSAKRFNKRVSSKVLKQIRKLSVTLFDEYNKPLYTWNQRCSIASHFEVAIRACINVEELLLSKRAPPPDSPTPSRHVSSTNKSIIKALKRYPNLKVLEITEGRFSAEKIRFHPKAQLNTLSLAVVPGDDWWNHWGNNLDLRSLTLRQLDNDDLIAFFQPIRSGDLKPQFMEMRILEVKIIDLRIETSDGGSVPLSSDSPPDSPPNGYRCVIDLRDADWMDPRTSGDGLNIVFNFLCNILMTSIPAGVLLKYSVPEAHRERWTSIKSNLKTLSDASSIVSSQTSDESFAAGIQNPELEMSGILWDVQDAMSSFANQLEERQGVKVEVEFVET